MSSILGIDIGGNNVKLRLSDGEEVRKIPSGAELTAKAMVKKVRAETGDWDFDRVAMGYPGPVHDGALVKEPINLGPGWLGFDFEKAFGHPVRIVNDATMQALGSYEGGKMLFLGLGTGLGSTMVVGGIPVPMELGHLPYKKGTFETHVGRAGLEILGKEKWRETVLDVVDRLFAALQPDYVVLGGGNAKKLEVLPEYARLGDNSMAFTGAFRLWEPESPANQTRPT